MAQADPRAERAAKYADILRTQRDTAAAYPPTASALRALLDPPPTDEEFFDALEHKSLIAAAKDDPVAPVALAEDADRLAASDALLTYAVGKLASQEKPLHKIDRVVSRVKKPLQAAFLASIQKCLAESALPPGVGVHQHKDEPHLYSQQYPPPPPKKVPGRDLAERLVATLRARAQQGETVAVLADLHTADDAPELKKALADETFTGAAMALPLSKTLTLAALSADLPALIAGDRLLLGLLEARTTPKKPSATPAELTEGLPEAHRETFLRSLADRLDLGRLPAGVSVRHEDGQRVLRLESKLPATRLLGEKLLAGLTRRRAAGNDYPIRLDVLARAEAPDASEELLAQLVKDRAFAGQVISAISGRTDSPVALPGDEEKLGTCRATLECAVGALSTREAPLHPLKKIVGKLDAGLRPAFEQAVTKHVAEGTLPATLAVHDVKGQPHLRRGDYPLPPPADVALAERLLAALADARDEGIYPLSVRAVLSRFSPEPTDRVVRAAMANNTFSTRAIVSLPGDVDSPAALVEDRVRLAAEPRLLEYALTRVRSTLNQAVAVADVCKALAQDLRPEFTVAVGQALAGGTLPPTVACLVIKKKPMLFLRSDLDGRPVIVLAAEQEVPESREEDVGEEEEPAGQERETVEQGKLF